MESRSMFWYAIAPLGVQKLVMLGRHVEAVNLMRKVWGRIYYSSESGSAS